MRPGADNPDWGYRRIHGELRRMGYRVAASTVWNILNHAGRDPTPDRIGPSWSQLITPQVKAFAERWVRTLIWNQRQLRRLLDDYVALYNRHLPRVAGHRQRQPAGPSSRI